MTAAGGRFALSQAERVGVHTQLTECLATLSPDDSEQHISDKMGRLRAYGGISIRREGFDRPLVVSALAAKRSVASYEDAAHVVHYGRVLCVAFLPPSREVGVEAGDGDESMDGGAGAASLAESYQSASTSVPSNQVLVVLRLFTNPTLALYPDDEAWHKYMYGPAHAPDSYICDTASILRGVKRELPAFLQPEGDNCTRTSESILVFVGAEHQ